ncbi:peptidoglycan-binding protein [Streptomyces sp. NBC_01013]|uniref:peptidoglycan-binding domain-containing protein n=1 Tax=Streptomyces sp. NBC_01013 TaxID=2903718 RepID=UPI0038635777|nr:peptidoglycan-binding protein [Streptomyces sp. NBC_01013]
MPFEQHINWTVLPAGFSDDGTQLRVSVFIAPRLTTTDQPQGDASDQQTLSTLGNFPDFVTWPERVKAATFEFATGEDDSAVSTSFTGRLDPQGPAPDADLWKKLFTEDTPLALFVFKSMNMDDGHTYPAREVSRLTRRTYAEAAKMSPEKAPVTGNVMRSLSLVSPDVEGVAAGQGAGAMPEALAALNAFHTLPEAPTIAADEETSPAPPTELSHPDFHQMLTSLGDHPKLLRRLGLVLDFLLPADRLPVSSGERFLTVVPSWADPHANSHDVCPHTFYVFLPDRHVLVPGAKSRTAADPLASPARGVLALPEKDFSLEQADIDGAAMEIAAHIRTPGSSDAKGLSPVRTHGISLVRDQRKEILKEELNRAVDHDKAFTQVLADAKSVARDPQTPGAAPPLPPAPKLVAEDLVRGHRMDIWDEERQRWFSLHERDVEYRRPDGGSLLFTASDEGFFQANLISLPPGMGDDKPYIPEPLATWEGWALSAPRPGLVLDTDEGSTEAHRPPNQPVEVSNKAMTALPLEITSKVRPGSLPRLRFGHQYRVRLRTVDLAGNGPTLAEADALMDQQDLALPGDGPLTFQRYEAVPAPAVAPRLPLAEGTSAFRMVIRSSPGSGPPPAPPSGLPENQVTVVLAEVRIGKTNDDVRIVQKALIAQGHSLPGGADGVFGDRTKAAYAAEQGVQGFEGSDADGSPGCESLTELGRKSGFAVDCATGPGGAGDHAGAEGQATGRTAEQYAADFNRSRLVTEEGHLPYQEVDERHVVAPKASLRCVEWHGLLDEAIGSTDQRAQDAVYELARRESGSLNDPALPDVRLEPIPSPAADPGNPAVTALHTGTQVDVPYLPDPLGTGAVFFDLPGMPAGKPFTVPWGGDVWHRPRSFRLRLAEGTEPPRFDEDARVLTVSLPRGAVATVRLCSAIDFDEKVMGMASWCREAPAPAPGLATETEAEAVERKAAEQRRTDHALGMAAAGRHWMFTPCQELTLVHAAQQPLKAPVLTLSPVAAPRGLNATAEHLAGSFALDEDSTDRIDLVAEWTEVTDSGPSGRDTRDMAVPVFDLLTARVSREGAPGTEPAILRDGILTFSTKAAEERAMTAADEVKALEEAATTVEERARAQALRIPPVPPKHEFGDTKHRKVSYRPVAGSRFGDCFPAQFSAPGQNALTVRGEAKEYSVPSSASPAAPRLLYCVPTLSLERLKHVDGPPGAIVHRRRGGGIRVFLDRPWFSSGDGELLGVVLGEPPGGDPTSVRDAWVTLMGRDPIHRSAPVVAPTADMFTNSVRQSGKLALHTPSGALDVTVVGFTPQFDTGEMDETSEKGGRWFCDLDIDTGDACLPFVRLALVRYQPDSIPGAEISQVVLADLVRTLPDRELLVTPGESLSVSVTGPSWDPTGSPAPQITAALQRRNSAVADEDLGWVTLEDTAAVLTSIDAESSRTPFYTGQIPVPPVRRGGPLRLVVVETEGIRADGPTPPTTPGPVVYCDTVNLSPGSAEPDERHDGHDDHGGHDGPGGHDGHDDHGGHEGHFGPGDHGGHEGHGGPGDHGGGFRHG